MKAILLFCTLLLCFYFSKAQNNPKQKQSNQPDIIKLMEDAMNADGMTKEEISEALKMVREGLELKKEYQEAGLTFQANDEFVYPKKQIALLNSLPKITSEENYKKYISSLLNTCSQKIALEIRQNCNRLLSEAGGDYQVKSNIPVLLYLNRNMVEAVFTALKVLEENPSNLLVLNNTASILLLAGYPHKAIPLLQYKTTTDHNAALLNNLGQCYFSLGDEEKAVFYLSACLLKVPDHPEANNTMGVVKDHQGKKAEAEPYIKKALQYGYSEHAEKIATKNKYNIGLVEIKRKNFTPPKYLSPMKYMPPGPAYSHTDVDVIYDKQSDYVDRMYEMQDLYNQKAERERLTDQQFFTDAKKNIGLATSPFFKKATYMLKLIANDLVSHSSRMVDMQKKVINAKLEFLESIKNGEGCEEMNSKVDAYLINLAPLYEDYLRSTVTKTCITYNEALYWSYFTQSNKAYNYSFYSNISNFANDMKRITEMHPIIDAASVTCAFEPTSYTKEENETIEPFCPISIAIKAGVGSLKMNCKTFEVSLGEGIIGKYAKDFVTGESTISAGLGVKWQGIKYGEDKEGPLQMEVGFEQRVTIKNDKNGRPCDIGIETEAGGEMKLGPIVIESKLIGTLMLEGGIHGNISAMGKELALF